MELSNFYEHQHPKAFKITTSQFKPPIVDGNKLHYTTSKKVFHQNYPPKITKNYSGGLYQSVQEFC